MLIIQCMLETNGVEVWIDAIKLDQMMLSVALKKSWLAAAERDFPHRKLRIIQLVDPDA